MTRPSRTLAPISLGLALLLGARAEAVPPDLARAERARVEALQAYRRAGRFPENLRGPGQQPMFIGDEGTRCAVGALLESTGHTELVQAIARERNLAYVPELADEPELVAWLEDNGLDLAEAAAVQPTYGYCASRAEVVCPPLNGVAAVVARVELEDLETSGFRVTEVLLAQSGASTATVGALISLQVGLASPVEQGEGLAVIVDPTGQARGYFVGLRDGRAHPAGDPCDVDVDLPLTDALAVLVEPDCTDRLDALDPRWAGGFCVYGLGGQTTVTCPGDDAGVADAEIAPKDAGGSREIMPQADGCTTAGPGLGPLGWLALGLLVARRRRSRCGEPVLEA